MESPTFCKKSFKRQKVHNNSYNTIQDQRRKLPIYKVRDQLREKFYKYNVIMFKGETACGKTTQIPQYLLEGGFAGKLTIAVTQPRRVAAISIAERVANEVGTQLGQKVGYHVRFEDVTSEKTKIKYVTDGMLLRESISDPLLSSYSWVILDEAHERTIHTDVLFGIVKQAQKNRNTNGNQPLKIIVMSATIDEDKFITYFDNAPIFYLPGRTFRITLYNSEPHDDYVALALSSVFHIHQNEPEGDILVFLTGEEEIESLVAETHKVLQEFSGAELKLVPCALYAALPSQLQCAALKPSASMTRKVIYSTNIAETSLTIPGVKYVIDTGRVKSKSFNSTCGLDLLKIQWVSKAQADQRMGRAGRECDGSCYQLYTKEQYAELIDFPIPEIQRCNLSSVLLQIIAIGISDIRTFDFLDRPSDENIDAALSQLALLGAIEEDENGKILLTECGKQMVNFPLDPRFSKMITTSYQFKCTDELLTIISLLSVESIFLTTPQSKEKFLECKTRFSNGDGDHVMLLNMYKAFRHTDKPDAWCLLHNVSYKSMSKAVAIRKQLHQICHRAGITPCSCGKDTTLIRKCLASGLFMNSAYLYKKREYKTIGSKQRVYIHPSSSLFRKEPLCCIYTDLVETSKCYMRSISVVDEDWLLDAAPEYFRKCGFKRFELVSM